MCGLSVISRCRPWPRSAPCSGSWRSSCCCWGGFAWIALWGIRCVAPLFLAVGAAGRAILAPFGFNAQIVELASEFWLPRVGGATAGMALWAMLSFFNGIGRSRVTALITGVTALANVPLNAIFIFTLGWGVAGSGLATTVAQAIVLA